MKWVMVKNKPIEKTQTSKIDDSQLHWFWRITTKWWFFPLFFYVTSLLLASIFERFFNYGMSIWYLGAPFFLSQGILYFFQDVGVQYLGFAWILVHWLIQATFYVYFIVSIVKIVKSKNKENIILKKQIVILFLLILLSSIGYILNNVYPPMPLFGA